MEKSLKHTVVKWYLLIFYALMLYKWSNGLWMYQMRPFLFLTRQDVFTWVFMQTRLHQWLLNHPARWVLADALFYGAPLYYYIQYRCAPRRSWMAAVCLVLIHWAYLQCYTLYGAPSIQGFIGWLLFPLLFIPTREKTFDFLWEGLRYFFLFFFASAGIWKFIQGGIFNHLEMSAILLDQHKELLSGAPVSAWARVYGWLIDRPGISYCLYAGATLCELSFITGFFTKRYDRVLAGIFLLFLLMDYLVMRIDYSDTLPLLLTLLPGTRRPTREWRPQNSSIPLP